MAFALIPLPRRFALAWKSGLLHQGQCPPLINN